MNENQQKNPLKIAHYISSSTLGKLSFYGKPYTQDSTEFKLLEELDEIGWETTEDGFYESTNILSCQTYLEAQNTFLSSGQENQGYQLEISPFSVLEMRFLFQSYCRELQSNIPMYEENGSLKIKLPKQNIDLIVGQAVLFIDTELSTEEKLEAIHIAQKNQHPLTVVRFCHELLQESPMILKDQCYLYWNKSIALRKIAATAFRSHDKNQPLCKYTTIYYLTLSIIDLLETLKSGDLANSEDPEYVKKTKPQAQAQLKKLKLNKSFLYPLLVGYAEKSEKLSYQFYLLKLLQEQLYPNDVSIQSRYLFLSTRMKKISQAYLAFQEKQYPECIKLFLHLIRNFQGEGTAEQEDYYGKLSYAYLKTKDYEKAQEVYSEAQRISSDEIEDSMFKAAIACIQGQYEKAITLYYQVILFINQIEPKNSIYTANQITSYYTHANYYAGKCLSALNHHTMAIDYFLQAVAQSERTGFGEIKTAVFARILHSHSYLSEKKEVSPLDKNQEIEIFFHAIKNAFYYAPSLLTKTFQLLPNHKANQDFHNKLTFFFLAQGNLEKIRWLCCEIVKYDIVLNLKTYLFLLPYFLKLPLSQLQTKDNHLFSKICKTAITSYPEYVELYEYAIQFLFAAKRMCDVTEIFKDLIDYHFELYLQVSIPVSPQLHYDLAEYLAQRHPETAFFHYHAAIQHGIKNNKKNKKFSQCSLKLISLAFDLNKDKEEVSLPVLQKIIQLAINNENFYEHLLSLLLTEQNPIEPGSLCYQLIMDVAAAFSRASQASTIQKALTLYLKISKHCLHVEPYLQAFSLRETLNRSSLIKHEIEDFYQTMGKSIIQHESISHEFISYLAEGKLSLPPLLSSIQLIHQLALLYPKHTVLFCDIALNLALSLPALDVKFHEYFIESLLAQNELEQACRYYQQIKKKVDLPNSYQKLVDAIYQQKIISLSMEAILIEWLKAHSDRLSFTGQLLLSTQNKNSKLYSIFSTQLNQTTEPELLPYCNLIQEVKVGRKQKRQLLKHIARIIELEPEHPQRSSKILHFCMAIIHCVHMPCGKKILSPIIELLIMDVNSLIQLIQKLAERHLSTALYTFKAILQKRPDFYQALLDAFPFQLKNEDFYCTLFTHLLSLKHLEQTLAYYEENKVLLIQEAKKTSFLKLLTQINQLNPEDFDVFYVQHSQTCFELATWLFESGDLQEKQSAHQILKKIIPLIDKRSDQYREIIALCYQRKTLVLPDHAIELFEELTQQFGDEQVYLTGGRILALQDNQITPSHDWDFVVFIEPSIADEHLLGSGFWKSRKLPGLYTKKTGIPPKEEMIEVFCLPLDSDQTIEEQLKNNALTRDFTICAIMLNLYGELFDFFGGAQDIQDHLLRMIGNPYERLQEDPIRILRATKYRLGGFNWLPELEEAIIQWANQPQALSSQEQKHIQAVVIKHLRSLEGDNKQAYAELLLEYKLWNKLLDAKTRMYLISEFNLKVPHEYTPYSPNNDYYFFTGASEFCPSDMTQEALPQNTYILSLSGEEET